MTKKCPPEHGTPRYYDPLGGPCICKWCGPLDIHPDILSLDYEDMERRVIAIYAAEMSKHGIPITVDNIITAMKESPMFLHDEMEIKLEQVQRIASRVNCDHYFQDTKHCIKCGVSFKQLKIEDCPDYEYHGTKLSLKENDGTLTCLKCGWRSDAN